MNMPFHTVVLSADRVAEALPLIQVTWPSVDLASWQSFAQFFCGQTAAGGSGVLALRASGGDLCGLLAYRLDRDLREGLILAVHLFTAVDLANSLRTIRALLEIAETQACRLGCAGIQIRLGNEQSGLASRLRSLGLSSEAGLFWRKVEPRAPLPN